MKAKPKKPPEPDPEPPDGTAKLVSVLGKVAGLGGISAGLGLLIFYQIAGQAGILSGERGSLRLLLILTFALAVAGLAVWAHTAGKQSRGLAVGILAFAVLMAALGVYLTRGETPVIPDLPHDCQDCISGIVKDEDGNEIPGAAVSAPGAETINTRTNGTFLIHASSPSPEDGVTLTVTTKDGHSRVDTVPSGSSNVEIVIDRRSK